jgi:16S rRNA processing protein RimM
VADPAAWLRAGRVGAPHGLDGSVHVGDPRPQLLSVGTSVTVAARIVRIVRRAGTDARPIVRLEGCEDRTAAEALRGEELLVPRGHAPELEADEWWTDDLEGCAVLDAEGGAVVGTVRRLLALPSCEVLEVERTGRDDLLVPLIGDAVPRVDIERREIAVDLAFLGEA